MKKNKLFSTISLILSGIMLVMSGFILVHSAQQQSATTSLTVTFDGLNVDFSAQAWYQVKNNVGRHPLKNGNATSVSFDASESSTTKTLSVVENNGEVALTATDTYVVFTYKFTNTASTGAKAMCVTLNNSTPEDSNIRVRYYHRSTDYTNLADDSVTTSQLTSIVSNITGTTAFSDVSINAGATEYFYIAVGLIDPTLPATYNPTITWSVAVSNKNTITFSGSEDFWVEDSIVIYQYADSSSINPTLPTTNGTSNPNGWTGLRASSHNLSGNQYILLTTFNCGPTSQVTTTYTFYEGTDSSGDQLGSLSINRSNQRGNPAYLYISASSSKNIYVVRS